MAEVGDDSVARFVSMSTTYYLKTKWNPSSFEVEVMDGHRCWTGNASVAYVMEELLPMGMELEEYMGRVRSALTQSGGRYPTSAFKVEFADIIDGLLELSWTMELDEIKLRGRLELHRSEDRQVAIHIVDHLNRMVSDLQQDRVMHLETSVKVQSLYDEQKKQLQILTGAKNEMEKGLYAKFVKVLNTKKKKLRSYAAEIMELKTELAAVRQAVASMQEREKAAAKPVYSDEDEPRPAPRTKRKAPPTMQPSPKRARTSKKPATRSSDPVPQSAPTLMMGASLGLLNDERTETTPPRDERSTSSLLNVILGEALPPRKKDRTVEYRPPAKRPQPEVAPVSFMPSGHPPAPGKVPIPGTPSSPKKKGKSAEDSFSADAFLGAM